MQRESGPKMTENNDALNNTELDQVDAGLGHLGGSRLPTSLKHMGDVFNARGEKVGQWAFDTLYYDKCPDCRKPMHQGTLGFMYCDPCGNRVLGYFMDTWEGTEKELKQASL